MASKVLKKKKNAKLKFPYRQSSYLTPANRLSCNMLIQPHFDCGCSLWFPLLKKNLKLKLQKVQNKFIRFCLNLPPRCHIDPSHFRKRNWLPVSDRIEYCIQIPSLSTRMEMHQDIFRKFLSLHSVDIAQDHRLH